MTSIEVAHGRSASRTERDQVGLVQPSILLLGSRSIPAASYPIAPFTEDRPGPANRSPFPLAQ